MQKISGGNPLECSHTQVISAFRYAAYQSGRNQRPVWCVECNDWSNIVPAPITDEPQEEDVDEGVDSPGDIVLDFPENE
jgi:hypothetical protein